MKNVSVLNLTRRLVCVVLLALLLGPGITSSCQPNEIDGGQRAAIIDQLSVDYPNEAFIQQVTSLLEGIGLGVDVYTGDQVAVDLYRRLPSPGYRVIIFRVHSGLLEGNPEHDGMTWLYTNEPYSKTDHVMDQLGNRVSRAQASREAPPFFAVSSKFVDEAMTGDFNGTVVIIMGCDGMHLADLALAFIGKGAAVTIGWNRSVTMDYTDTVMLAVLKKTCVGNATIIDALLQTMQEYGPDPETGAILQYYPQAGGLETLADLVSISD